MFYTSVKDHAGQRSVLALGPFRTHGGALARVDEVRRFVHEHFPREAPWCAYGTCRAKTRHAPGKFNDQLDYQGPGELP